MERIWYEICQKDRETGALNGPFGILTDKLAAEKAGYQMFGDDAIIQEGSPDSIQGWGVGKKADEKAFDTTYVGARKVDLIFGEHPHSRQDNRVYARWESGAIEGFNGHHLLHEITFKDHNYLKESYYSGNEVRKGGECSIKINGTTVETFFYRNIEDALHRAAHRLPEIHEFTIRLWDSKERASLVGRKIYYRSHPAIITRFIADQACVMIRPDPETESFPLLPYEIEEQKQGQTIEIEHEIKDTIYSNQIWWWRN